MQFVKLYFLNLRQPKFERRGAAGNIWKQMKISWKKEVHIVLVPAERQIIHNHTSFNDVFFSLLGKSMLAFTATIQAARMCSALGKAEGKFYAQLHYKLQCLDNLGAFY